MIELIRLVNKNNRLFKRSLTVSNSEKFVTLKNKKYITMIVLFLLSVIVFSLFYQGRIKYIVENKTYMEFIMDNEDSNLGEIKEDMKLEQTFKAKDDFKGISVRFSTYGRENEGNLNVKLIDQENDSIIQEWSMDTKELKDNAFQTFELGNTINNCKDKEYKIELDLKGLDDKNAITLTTSIVDQYKDGELYINGELKSFDLCVATISLNSNFLKYIYLAIAIILTVLVVGVYYLIFIKKAKIENVFLVSAICLGLTCTFLQTPYSNYDEPAHINTAYRYSNKLFGINNSMFNGPLPKRAIDNYGGLSYDRTSISTYKTVYDNLFKMADESERQIVPMNVTRVKEAPYIYLPSVIGITIARVLHLGQIPLLMLGRIFNLAFFIAACYFAIRKIPFAKIILFVVALLPINLSQNSTFSYDAVIIGLAYLFTAYCLNIAFGKEKVNKKDLLIFFIIAVLLAPLKKVYVLICFIALIIPKERFSNVRKYRTFILSLLCAIGVFYIAINVVEAIGIITKESEVAVFSQVEAYTVGDIIADPIHFIKVFINSLWCESHQFIYHGIMAFYKITLNETFTVIYIILLVLSTIRTNDEEVYLKPIHKAWIAMIITVIISALFGAGFTWTAKGEYLIQGVQGRYVLPFLPFGLLLARNSNLSLKKDINKELMFSSVICGVIVLTNLFTALIVNC